MWLLSVAEFSASVVMFCWGKTNAVARGITFRYFGVGA